MKEVTYETLSTAVRALSERITALDEHLGSAADLAKGFQYNGCTVRR